MKIITTKSGHEIKVDDEDYPLLSRYTWAIRKSGKTMYAQTNVVMGERRTAFQMHRLIMGMTELHVDHANGDGLDNRKTNLRLCTRSQNMANSRGKRSVTGYRGVHLNNYSNRKPNWKETYTARIRVDNKRIRLGSFKCPIEAAETYDKAALKYFGEFAVLNFPDRACALLERKETP